LEIRDFIVTPIYFILFLILAYLVRPYLTDENTRRYFYPALLLKFFGAIGLGLIYQFYYEGGDTFNFHTGGSRIIWEAFFESPTAALSMIFSNGTHTPEYFNYSSRIYFFSDSPSFFVIRVAAIIDILTYSSYSATALFFAFYSFIGGWLLFLTFYKRYQYLHFWIAIGCLFIPSVFFWGSGILKDTLVMGGLGIILWALDGLLVERRVSIFKIALLILAIWSVFSLKKFILQAYLPSAIIWLYLSNLNQIKSAVLRLMVLPFVIVLSIVGAYYATIKIGENDKRYSVENLVKTSQITARDIRFQSGRLAGSGYELSEFFDGSLGSGLRLAPQAINVTLFRPYLWEVKNPLMLISALENLVFLLVTLYIVLRRGYGALGKIFNPEVAFCFTFSITYAFAVGVSTYNFGTLARYKIPLMPFYFVGLVILYDLVSPKKTEVLESTEKFSATV
jgi:hypothetical protein